MNPYPGQDWWKIKDGKRLAQVSGLDADYVYMYWPDRDQQTRVRRERLNRTTEWTPVSQSIGTATLRLRLPWVFLRDG